MSASQDQTPVVFSVGHSNQELDELLELLRNAEIQAIADVRSVPRSGYSPQFDRAPLERALTEAGIHYVFLGRELGGRPDSDDHYDPAGHVRYDLVAQTSTFNDGVDRLLEGAARFRVAMLCSEEDPEHCHRRLLIGRVLNQRGVQVRHLRGDGSLVDEVDLGMIEAPQVQGSLFEGGERTTWRSTRPVLRDGQPRSSSTV